MRTIEIGSNDPDTNWLVALMVFPNDEKLRNTCYTIHRLQRDLMVAKPTDSFKLDLDAARLLVNAAAGCGVGRQIYECGRRGNVAGDFLLTMFVMHSFPSKFAEPSIRKAIHVAKVRAINVRYRDGSVMPRSDSQIREYISEFKSVAHLWAAARAVRKFMPDTGNVLWTLEGRKTFLEIAAVLQDFALEFRPRRGKKEQWVSPEDIWRVPHSVHRPKLGWEEPPRWIETALRTYKAPPTR